MKKALIGIAVVLVSLVSISANAQTLPIKDEKTLSISFFYSTTCPHCRAEHPFLDNLEVKYPELKVSRYLAQEPKNQELLQKLLIERGAEQYFGSVPITFVGSEVFLGFDNADGVGKAIVDSIEKQLASLTKSDLDLVESPKAEPTVVGVQKQDGQRSLAVLAISLGTLDGFNVCSLGALVLILSMVLVLRSRRQVFLYGGIFIITTAVVYGLLIVFWHQLFSLLGEYLRLLDLALGLLGVIGAVYFFREFLRFRRYGPACQVGGTRLISRMAKVVERSFGSNSTALLIAGSILLFAAVVTLVEFPCSAAVPVMFAGILAKANLPGLAYVSYLALYLLLYLLDELIVFVIAVWKLSIWMGKGKFVTYAALIQAILLFTLGGYYLLSFVK